MKSSFPRWILRLDIHLLGKSMDSMINSEEIWPMV